MIAIDTVTAIDAVIEILRVIAIAPVSKSITVSIAKQNNHLELVI